MSKKELIPSIIDPLKKEIATLLNAKIDQAIIGISENILKSLSTGMN